MKRYFVVLVLVVLAAIVTIGLVTKQKRRAHSLLHKIPTPKPHLHVSPKGDVVEHIHIYPAPVPTLSTEAETSEIERGPTDKSKKKTRVQIAWEDLVDVETVKRDLQPYTIAEMHEMWEKSQTLTREAHPETYISTGMDEIDRLYPRDEWIQRYMDLGHPFYAHWNYRQALLHRSELAEDRKRFNNTEPRYENIPDSSEKTRTLRRLGLPPETTWEEYEETFIKWKVVSANVFDRAFGKDSSLDGGTVSIDGVFTPFKANTVYAYVSNKVEYSKFTGANLTREEKDNLMMYGVAPEGIHVVYTDAKGNPLPPDTPTPRFYERHIKQLEEAQAHVEKVIADHEMFFKSLPEQTQKPEPPGPHNIQLWFEVLQELHGGDLPKDLRDLQQVIKELDAIRQAGEEKMQPNGAPQGHRPPERSNPKASTPPELPEAQ